jgi:hypothetical protein
MPKIYDETAHAAAQLHEALQKEFDRDGVRTSEEEQLLRRSASVGAFAEVTCALVRLCLRLLGGGKLDRVLLGEISDALRLLERVVAGIDADVQKPRKARLRYIVYLRAKNSSRRGQVSESLV